MAKLLLTCDFDSRSGRPQLLGFVPDEIKALGRLQSTVEGIYRAKETVASSYEDQLEKMERDDPALAAWNKKHGFSPLRYRNG